jgi:hypothetical protein
MSKIKTPLKLVKENAMSMNELEFKTWFMANIDTLMNYEYSQFMEFHVNCTKTRIESSGIEFTEQAEKYLVDHANQIYINNYKVR